MYRGVAGRRHETGCFVPRKDGLDKLLRNISYLCPNYLCAASPARGTQAGFLGQSGSAGETGNVENGWQRRQIAEAK